MGMLELLHQDEVWTDKQGVTRRLEDMDPAHRANLLALLERLAPQLKSVETHLLYSAASHMHGEMALDSIDSMISRNEVMSDEEWLESMPLVERLRQIRKKERKAFRKAMRKENKKGGRKREGRTDSTGADARLV